MTETAYLSGWEFEADNSPNSVYVLRNPPLKLNE